MNVEMVAHGEGALDVGWFCRDLQDFWELDDSWRDVAHVFRATISQLVKLSCKMDAIQYRNRKTASASIKSLTSCLEKVGRASIASVKSN